MTYDQFCLLLGDKDVQIYRLSTRIAELEAKLKELTPSDGAPAPVPAN